MKDLLVAQKAQTCHASPTTKKKKKKKHLYRHGLHLNRTGFMIFFYWLLSNQTKNASIKKENNSCKYLTGKSDSVTKGLKILRLKHAQNPSIAQININSIRNKFEL